MDIEIFVCDDAAGLIRTRGSIESKGMILYQTEHAEGEKGELTRTNVAKRRSAAEIIATYEGKFILVAARD